MNLKPAIVLLLGLSAAPAVGWATDNVGGNLNDSTLKTVIRLDPPPGGGRHKMPGNSDVGILCIYGRGWLKLDLPRGVYSATVTLTSATYQWNGLATTDQPYTEIPELEGRYTIVLRTDDSQTYSGSIEF